MQTVSYGGFFGSLNKTNATINYWTTIYNYTGGVSLIVIGFIGILQPNSSVSVFYWSINGATNMSVG